MVYVNPYDLPEELFLLSQRNQQGYEAANDIIGKLLKKRSDAQTSWSGGAGGALSNASAFVHSCVTRMGHAQA